MKGRPWTTANLLRRTAMALALGTCLVAGASARAEDVVVSHYAELMYGVPWAVALDQGYFKKYGAPVTGVTSSNGGGTTIRNMLAGSLPYTETAFASVVAAVHDGVDLKIVNGAVSNAADLVWVTMPNSPVKTIKDLVGRKMAYTRPGSTTQLFAVLALNVSNIPLDKVKRVSLGSIGGGLTGLEHGVVDAAPELEPIYSRNIKKYRLVFSAADVLPPIAQHVGVVKTQFLHEHPAEVKAIIEARRDGVIFLNAHPDEAAKITAKAYDMPVDIIRQALGRLIKAHYWSEGKIDYQAMDRAVSGLHDLGVYPEEKADWSKIADESALPDDLKSKK